MSAPRAKRGPHPVLAALHGLGSGMRPCNWCVQSIARDAREPTTRESAIERLVKCNCEACISLLAEQLRIMRPVPYDLLRLLPRWATLGYDPRAEGTP